LIVRDALVNWTAVQYFSFDFFKELYLHNLSRVSGYYSDRCQFFPYKTEFRNLREALSMSEQRKSQPWYFGW
jgi:histone arginine demethylase JMJD6